MVSVGVDFHGQAIESFAREQLPEVGVVIRVELPNDRIIQPRLGSVMGRLVSRFGLAPGDEHQEKGHQKQHSFVLSWFSVKGGKAFFGEHFDENLKKVVSNVYIALRT